MLYVCSSRVMSSVRRSCRASIPPREACGPKSELIPQRRVRPRSSRSFSGSHWLSLRRSLGFRFGRWARAPWHLRKSSPFGHFLCVAAYTIIVPLGGGVSPFSRLRSRQVRTQVPSLGCGRGAQSEAREGTGAPLRAPPTAPGTRARRRRGGLPQDMFPHDW